MVTMTIHYGGEKPIKAVGVHQCRLLAFAYEHQGWHYFNTRCRSTTRAVLSLVKKGYLEIEGDAEDRFGGWFKFKFPK